MEVLTVKTTTRLYDIIYGELDRHRVEIYRSNNQIIFNQSNLMRKTLEYKDPNFIRMLQETLFYGTSNINQRERFEREFLQRFINRVIKFQTVDLFSTYLASFVSEYQELINYTYDKYDMLVTGQVETVSNNNSTSTNKSNSIYSNLPQNQINMNLDIDTLDYADDNTISKSRATNSGTDRSTSSAYDIEALNKISALKEQIFKDMDSLLFSQLY